MKKKLSVILLCVLWGALTLGCWLLPDQDGSYTERRPLDQMPELSIQTVLSGKFMSEFEDYTLDQFPLRDDFRGIKSLFHYNVMGHSDNNDIYLHDGYAAKQEYPLNERSLTYVLSRFNYLYEKYLTESNVYMAVVPDKGYYLAEPSGHLSLDYEKLFSTVREQMPWATHVDLTDTLGLEDYYRTDTHWKQENLIPAAQKLTEALGVTPPKKEDFRATLVPKPFYGVYYGHAALPMKPDTMVMLSNELLSQCTVLDHESGKTTEVYDMSQLDSWDLYSLYLSGSKSLLTIENPNAATDKELVVFRDSFGSSMVPLLLHDYAKVTMVDIRYIRIDTLEKFLEFEGKDVLLMYSTLVLNQGTSIQ